MSTQDEIDILASNKALYSLHPLTERTEPRGEPGEVYKALKSMGGSATAAQLILATAARLLGNEVPLTMERRARIAIERAVRTGWVNFDGISLTISDAPTKSLTGQF